MAVSDQNLIWVDMEMTGLIPEEHRVIEIATIVTDSNLTVLAEGPVLAIHQNTAALDAMDEWNTRTHTGSGLVDRVRSSTLSEHAATEATLAFLADWVPAGQSPMCGNSICQDRRFMATVAGVSDAIEGGAQPGADDFDSAFAHLGLVESLLD